MIQDDLFFFLYLRYTLTGFEINYHSRNPFLANNKQIVNTIHRGDVPLFFNKKPKLVNKLTNKGLNFSRGLNSTAGPQVSLLPG